MKHFSYAYPYIRAAYYLLGLFGLVLLFYFTIELQLPVLTIHSGEIVNDKVMPGDTLRMDWRISVYRRCHVEVDRQVRGECGVFPLDGYHGILPGKESINEVHHVTAKLPKSINKGSCHYRAEMTIYCNPLAKIFTKVITFPDLSFEVVDNGDLH